MAALRFTVPVAAPPDRVAHRLAEAGERPGDLVAWFTDDPAVRATVAPSSDPSGWRARVQGSAFTADVVITVAGDGTGSVIGVDGRLDGRGLFAVASPALALARPRVEAEARRALQREFGAPAEGR